MSAPAPSPSSFPYNKEELAEMEERVREEEARIQAEVDERRDLIWEMMVMGAQPVRIARELKLPIKQVTEDIEHIRMTMAAIVTGLKVDPSKVAEEIGITIKRLDWIYHNAAMQYEATKNEQNKDRFLNTAMKATLARGQILVATGYLPKAGSKLEITTTARASFKDMFGKEAQVLDDPAKRREALTLAHKILSVDPLAVRTKEA